MKKQKIGKHRILLIMISLIAAMFLIQGCSGSGSNSDSGPGQVSDDSSNPGSDPEQPSTQGEISIGLTDAAGDFLSYTVDVVSLTLTKANGETVNTLPQSTTVDFAQYTDMTEFLTAATISSGVYTKATITLNYFGANIIVEKADGTFVKANAIDSDGEQISEMVFSVQLENSCALVIAPGAPRHLTLDFNLQASNIVPLTEDGDVEVNDDGGVNVTVEPTLIASVNPDKPKDHRLRGSLDDVNTSMGSFNVNVRPFLWKIPIVDHHLGKFKVITGVETAYEIDGELYEGQEGIVALASLDQYTAVIVKGDLTFEAHALLFEAKMVYAGSSVPGIKGDVITGNVIRRDENTLTVRGSALIQSDPWNRMILLDNIIVNVDADTKVTKENDIESDYFIDDISVGQKVTIFGTMSDEHTTSPTFDAIGGNVRMHITNLKGIINSADPLNINIQSIDFRPIRLFDFTDTGADPENFKIDTGSLDISNLADDTQIKVKGFVNKPGEESNDFNASTVVSLTDVKSYVKISWQGQGTYTPFGDSNVDNNELIPNLEGKGLFHHLGTGWVVTDLEDLNSVPSIKPAEDNKGLFIIFHKISDIRMFLDFTEFTTELNTLLDSSNTMKTIFASGYHHDGSLTTRYVTVTTF